MTWRVNAGTLGRHDIVMPASLSVVRRFVEEAESEPADVDLAELHDDLANISFHPDAGTLAHLAELGIGVDVDEYG